MATRKIILKTAKARKGTVTRTAIRKAVQTVFGASKAEKSVQSAKVTGIRRSGAGVLHAQ